MPQPSLYINAETLAKIENAARMNQTSISKWVNDRLKEALSSTWSENYETLFGSITDETFEVNRSDDFDSDRKRDNFF